MLLFVGACSDYTLDDKPDEPSFDTGDPVDSHGDTGLDTDSGRTCPTELLPGFVGTSDTTCANEVEVGTFDPVVEWSWTANTAFPGYDQVMSTPAVGDLDGDALPDVVFTTYAGTAWNNVGTLVRLTGHGDPVFEIDEAGGHHFQGAASVALGDLEGDGSPDICVPGDTAAVVCLEADGTFKWAAGDEYSHYGGPAIADLDGDGRAEVILGRQVFDAAGALIGLGSAGRGAQTAWWDGTDTMLSFAADIDADGMSEIVAGNAVYEMDGSLVWTDGGPDGFPAVADFDGDGLPEVVRVYAGTVVLNDTDGTQLWVVSPGFGGQGGPPTVADFDGDGAPEIGVAGASFYTVLEADGTTLWQVPVTDASSNMTGSSVFDFEGDGAAEVVYADEHSLWVFDGATGAVELELTEHASATAFEYPVIADVDGDGSAEILVVSNDAYISGWKGLRAIGDATSSWRPGRPTWNQHAYSITNVEDDLSIPTTPTPNWETYNNFRSGDPASGYGTSLPDVVVAEGDVCELECDDGRLVVRVHPGNIGAVEAVGATLALYGDDVLLASVALAPLAAGAYADSVVFELEGVSTITTLVARIEAADECDPDNNELRLAGPFCP